MRSLPYVRVVVLNWNAAWLTSRCLRSLERTDYPADRFELVVVDNASIDGSLVRLQAAHPTVRFIANEANLGFAEGNNRAMRDLDGIDAVALVNNDATVEPKWLVTLVERLVADPTVGAVAPKILLEARTAPVHVDAGRAVISSVEVDGIDATRRCQYDGFSDRAHSSLPLVVEHVLRDSGTVGVPSGPHGADVTIRWSDVTKAPVVRNGSTIETDAGWVTTLRVGPAHDVRINSLGTELTPWTEGTERWFGAVDRPNLAPHDTWGFSGGGVLLRAETLRATGLFDPSWFAYYEDTDLAWRIRRAGWRIECAPDAVLHHLHGGSAGPEAQGFFFLNYRNWLLTVLRNGSPLQIVRSWATAVQLSWGPFRRNVFGPLRRRRRPDLRITSGWARVGLGFAAACPSVFAARLRRRSPGLTNTTEVRSSLMPSTPPRAPRPRPGGPLIVYIDVTETLRSGWRAGIQRVVTEFVRSLPEVDHDLDVVPVVWSKVLGSFRRIDTAEYAALLAPTAQQQPMLAPARPSAKRRLAAAMMHRSGLAPVVYRYRRRKELGAVPQHHRDLILEQFAPGAVFFDVDATWNPTTRPRAEFLDALSDSGVTTTLFVHDLIPIRHPEWFIPQLVDVFTAHIDAHLDAGSALIANSQHTANDLADYAVERGADRPNVVVSPLGANVVERDDAVDRFETPTFLIVGTVEPRKGHTMVLDAFEQLRRSVPDAQLIVVGRGGWRDDGLIERLRNGLDGVDWRDAVSDDELDELYRRVTAVIVASHTEGFGLPVLEALLRETPVVSSTGGALREAGGDAALYFEVGDAAALTRHLLELSTSPQSLYERRRLAAAHRSDGWDQSATLVATALHAAAAHPDGEGTHS
ncbi:MAG: glycosyltransferase [Actinobacteria bacterium]|nr:glycosyltransferase [Actinomycetota bacterium]